MADVIVVYLSGWLFGLALFAAAFAGLALTMPWKVRR